MRFDRLHRALRGSVILILLALSSAANAVLTIEIVGSGATQFPIAIVPFRAEGGLSQPISPVVSADLARSGVFKLVDAGGINPPPSEPQDVNYGTWRARGADAVVIGTIAPLPDGRYDVRFRLMDVAKQTQLAGFATEEALSFFGSPRGIAPMKLNNAGHCSVRTSPVLLLTISMELR